MRKIFLLTLAIGLASVVATTTPAWAKDFAHPGLDIVPSGQYGAVPQPADATEQADMYNALTPLFNHVSAADMNQDFKPMTIGTATPGPTTTESVPHPGVTIVRDAFDVPHIFGQTRDDVTWGAGWVIAEDRGLLLQQARYDSLVAAIDAPGLSALGLVSNLQNFKPSQQTINEVSKQTNVLEGAGQRGKSVLHDIDIYLQGINAYFSAHGSTAPPFTRTDIYGFNALKDQFVGEGGGNEAPESEFLSGLQHRLGKKKGWKVFNDLRELKDPETPTSLPGKVQFQKPPTSTSGNVILDNGSLSSTANQAISAWRAGHTHASNALLLSGARSSTHHPIMVAGPQIGYFYPGLTLEMDLNGPGINERGVTSAPFPGYIFIGRSQDSAWSLTSAGLDQIDTYVETLCGGSTHKYMYKGKCRDMQFFDAGSLSGQEVTFYRTVHGPVIGYARVHGRQVALSRKRASYGKDAEDLLFYHDLAHSKVHNVHQFFKAACLTPQTFNSIYADDKDIGMFTSGLVPLRPSNADQGLPIDGRGQEEWKGDVSCQNHPQGIDPKSGEIVNWNNRSQAGYQAPDTNWSLGAVQRVDLLLENLGTGKETPQKVVSAMNAAATQDVREITFEPVLSKLLKTGKAPTKRAAQILKLLDSWRKQGGSRLDRTGNGQITAPGAAIMDTAWPLLANAWAKSVLGTKLSAQFATFTSQYDQPPGGQYTGWHIYMEKDLRTILGEKVKGTFSVRYCGGGNLKKCRKALWSALVQAGNELATKQGTADPSAWHSSATAEEIAYVPGLLKASPTSSQPFMLRYTNRPSGIQEIVSFTGHLKQDTGRGQQPSSSKQKKKKKKKSKSKKKKKKS